MIKKLLSYDALLLIVIPAFVVFVEQIIKKALGYYDLNISLTLSSIALGQILPFVLFENLLINKILKLKPNYITNGNTFQVSYTFQNNKSPKHIENTKKTAYFLFFICLVLFMLNVYFTFRGDGLLEKNVYGIINAVVVWGFMIFD